MNFAKWAKMSPRDRMMAGLRGSAMPTRGVEFADGRTGARLGMIPTAGLGALPGSMTAPSTSTVTPAASAMLSPTRALSPASFDPSTFGPVSPTGPASTVSPTGPANTVKVTTTAEASPTGPSYSSGRTPSADDMDFYSSGGKDEYTYDDYARSSDSNTSSRASASPVFPVDQKPQPKQTVDMVKSAMSGVPTWLWIAGAAAVAYLVMKD